MVESQIRIDPAATATVVSKSIPITCSCKNGPCTVVLPADELLEVFAAEPELGLLVGLTLGVAAKVVYARRYETSKYALSNLGLPGPTTLSLYCYSSG